VPSSSGSKSIPASSHHDAGGKQSKLCWTEPLYSSEMSVDICRTTQCHVPDDSSLNQIGCLMITKETVFISLDMKIPTTACS
jgi:hypothetical protein